MEDLYVVSDVHGDHVALREALHRAKVIDERGIKDPKAYVVQIGDLANCVMASVNDDLECLGMVGNEIDLMLFGNHEIPYFDSQNRFSGFYRNAEISYVLYSMYDAGVLSPVYLHDDRILITHAGITLQQLNLGTGTTAESVYEKLVTSDLSHYLFTDVGRARYGKNNFGGVLWCDFNEEFTPTEFPQIVGHTPGVLRVKGNAICIDTQQTTGYPTVLKVS